MPVQTQQELLGLHTAHFNGELKRLRSAYQDQFANLLASALMEGLMVHVGIRNETEEAEFREKFRSVLTDCDDKLIVGPITDQPVVGHVCVSARDFL